MGSGSGPGQGLHLGALCISMTLTYISLYLPISHYISLYLHLGALCISMTALKKLRYLVRGRVRVRVWVGAQLAFEAALAIVQHLGDIGRYSEI